LEPPPNFNSPRDVASPKREDVGRFSGVLRWANIDADGSRPEAERFSDDVCSGDQKVVRGAVEEKPRS
jgi:hypothetical protein